MPSATCSLELEGFEVESRPLLLEVTAADSVLLAEIVYGDTIVVESVMRLVSDAALGELIVILLVTTAEVPSDT